jgi:hypothetical protein
MLNLRASPPEAMRHKNPASTAVYLSVDRQALDAMILTL